MSVEAADLVAALEHVAPPEFAESWDRIGLHVAGDGRSIGRVLLTIDLTEPVMDEAEALGVDAVVAYHPPIFEPLERLVGATAAERIVTRAVRAGMLVHSPHTALDAAPGGVNDWVADGLGRGDRSAIVPAAQLPESEQVKIVTFAPADAVDRIRDGMAAAGAGRVGLYERCSFELPGHGTFFGTEETSPAVGEVGRLERVAESRIEMVAPRSALAIALTSLRRFHPYEEPAIEIHPLEPRPIRDAGSGRRLVLDQAVTIEELATRVRDRLGVARVRIARAHGAATQEPGSRVHQTVGLCVGAGASLLAPAIGRACTAFITGEMRHHDVLRAQASGCDVILAGHSNTERGYLPLLRDRLAAELGSDRADVLVSEVDADPLERF